MTDPTAHAYSPSLVYKGLCVVCGHAKPHAYHQPVAHAMTDHAAIDLGPIREIWQHRGSDTQRVIMALIAAVEALRERVAEYDCLFDMAQERERPWIEAWRKATGKHHILPDYGKLVAWIYDRAEAAEAHATELAGALERIVKGNHRCSTPTALLAWAQDEARAALAATPAGALERARAKDEVVEACRKFERLVDAGQILTATTLCKDTLANLDALDQEDGT